MELYLAIYRLAGRSDFDEILAVGGICEQFEMSLATWDGVRVDHEIMIPLVIWFGMGRLVGALAQVGMD